MAGRQIVRLSVGRRERERDKKKSWRNNENRPTPSITLTIAASRAKLAIIFIERKTLFFMREPLPRIRRPLE